jgi:hypothetical protein
MRTSDIDYPRIYVRVEDPPEFLRELECARGVFLRTRAPVRLGQAAVAVLKLPEVERPIELPVLIAGRRVRRGGDGRTVPGIVARPTDQSAGALELFRDAVAGRFGGLGAEQWRGHRRPTTSVFASVQELHARLRALLVGRGGTFLLDTPVRPGEALLLTCVVPASMLAITFTARVRRVSHYEHDYGCHAELLDPEYRGRLEAFLQRSAGDAKHA